MATLSAMQVAKFPHNCRLCVAGLRKAHMWCLPEIEVSNHIVGELHLSTATQSFAYMRGLRGCGATCKVLCMACRSGAARFGLSALSVTVRHRCLPSMGVNIPSPSAGLHLAHHPRVLHNHKAPFFVKVLLPPLYQSSDGLGTSSIGQMRSEATLQPGVMTILYKLLHAQACVKGS